jgi:hypothetical protein
MSVGACGSGAPGAITQPDCCEEGDRICDTDVSISSSALVLYRTADGYMSPFAKCYRPHLRSGVTMSDFETSLV